MTRTFLPLCTAMWGRLDLTTGWLASPSVEFTGGNDDDLAVFILDNAVVWARGDEMTV